MTGRLYLIAIATLAALAQAPATPPAAHVNALKMTMLPIPAGTFRMGNDQPTDPALYHQSRLLHNGDYDEKPVHNVTLTGFYMSETEVTVAQFQAFRMDHQDAGRFPPYATGMSWDDAAAFCQWLSVKEKKNYRLPTEAEWEYAAIHEAAFGLKNMQAEAMEWTLDWYGPYPFEPQTDPAGPATGFSKVVRGGGIMGPNHQGGLNEADGFAPYYRRPANRASVAPAYRGAHAIGFRVVEAPMPRTPPLAVDPPLTRQFVKQTGNPVTAGPDPNRPWFRQRNLLPIPPEDMNADAIEAAGLDPAINGHNHSGGLAVCANGDLLYMAFSSSSSSTEYLPNTTFVAARLRFGSDQWDFPALHYDFADINEQSALLWNDGGTMRFFGGGIGLAGVPFRMQSSTDSGVTWSQVEFPLLRGPVGGYSPQPITSAFRGATGDMYLASDAVAGESLLWISHDNGVTWSDTGGRTAGRHTAFIALKDGRILGLGGKNTDIDGFMPQSISSDSGKTWTVTRTNFPALGSNQRPALIRLASGRLFVASDFQHRSGRQPRGVTERGVFVGLSDDEGQTWHIRRVPTALPHEAWVLGKREWWNTSTHGDATFGYTVAAQAPNGIIHVAASMNHPSQHYEFNEAWILGSEASGTATAAQILKREQRYPNGNLQASWSGRIDTTGRFLLEGEEAWLSPDGSTQYQATWREGRKTGLEICYSPRKNKIWQWDRRADGIEIWTQFWPDGTKRHESYWRDGVCFGEATAWSPDGRVIKRYNLDNATK